MFLKYSDMFLKYSDMLFLKYSDMFLKVCRYCTILMLVYYLYTKYPIVARALGLAAFRPSTRASKSILHTSYIGL